jgi:copper resistance protein D
MESLKYIPSLRAPISVSVRQKNSLLLLLIDKVSEIVKIGTYNMATNYWLNDMSFEGALATWVHIICSSIWVGGSIFIGLVLAPALKNITSNTEERLLLMVKFGRRFNNLAIPSFMILVGTGIYNARSFLANPESLWQTQYGMILLIKIILVVTIIFAYIIHVKTINKDTERKLITRQMDKGQISTVRSRIIILGRITVLLSVSVLFLASLLDSGGY